MKVCKLYQLARLNNEFTLAHKQLLRDRVVVSDDYIETINQNYKDSGRYYEVDEKATIDYYELGKSVQEKRQAEKESKAETVVNAVSEALTEVIEKRGRKPKKIE
jgi:hypothetical protein